MTTVLENDDEFARNLPRRIIVSASAGSGKTTELTRRMVQFLLSPSLPSNGLRNILAITFTNNAALEMKHRVLETLKRVSLGQRDQLTDLSSLLSYGEEELKQHAAFLVDQLLEEYSDVHIQTIDSFLAKVFRASALEFGLTPDFEIVLSSDQLLREAFENMARDVTPGSASAALFEDLTMLALSTRSGSRKFIWNPYEDLYTTVRGIYGRIMQYASPVRLQDHTRAIRQAAQQVAAEILSLEASILRMRLVPKYLDKAVEAARSMDLQALGTVTVAEVPFKVSGLSSEVRDRAEKATRKIVKRIWKLQAKLLRLAALQHYQSYAAAFSHLEQHLLAVRQERGVVDIAEISRGLARYVQRDVVPEVYYRLGEDLRHFLIDEFQDTAPIQWRSLEPLIENALAERGSLFVVGDTKQSIYMFRGADWRIMQKLQTRSVFPMAPPDVRELKWNYRSGEKIVAFSREVFQKIVPAVSKHEGHMISGLAHFVQDVPPHLKGKGHVEVHFVPRDADAVVPPEKELLLKIIADCRSRGYALREIAVLTPKNQHVVEVSSWLNEQGIEFISHSSLDIRTRKVTSELLSLLRFLDSPVDDLAFVTFLLGDILGRALERAGIVVAAGELRGFVRQWSDIRSSPAPAYRLFRDTYPQIWERYFQRLFALVGYLSLYDLTAEIFKVFTVFDTLPEEEAALVKFLEVVRNMEEGGSNSLKEFLQSSGESSDDGSWDIDVPVDANAVQIMTTHKAKGLGFRVVVALLYDSARPTDPLYVAETSGGVELLHLTKQAENVEGLAELYREKVQREEADLLNQLYVLFTRAQEEMYVLCVEGPKAELSKFLPRSGYEPTDVRPGVQKARATEERHAPLLHDHTSLPMKSEIRTMLAPEETARGEFVHEVLARIEFLDVDLLRQVKEAVDVCKMRSGEAPGCDPESIAGTLQKFLGLAPVREFFSRKEGRQVMNEQEFVDRSGRLFRMDRVVVDTETVTVIDYKTGDDAPGYQAQVVTYMHILQDLFPGKSIRGTLAFVDRLLLKEVGAENTVVPWDEDPWNS